MSFLALEYCPTQGNTLKEIWFSWPLNGLSCAHQVSASINSSQHYCGLPLGMPFHSDSEGFQISAVTSLEDSVTSFPV